MPHLLHSVPGGFQVTKREILTAIETPKDAYPFSTTCAVCENVWGAHMGKLCPAGNEPDRVRELMHYVAMGELPSDAIERPKFRWRGSFFVPLLDCDENPRSYSFARKGVS